MFGHGRRSAAGPGPPASSPRVNLAVRAPLLSLAARTAPLLRPTKSMTDEPIDWVAIRAEFEDGGINIIDLAAAHGISRRRLCYRADAEGWMRRSARRPATRSVLIGRLYRVLERQIAQLETNMTDANDKEATLLGSLTRNLERLIELDLKEKGQNSTAPKRADIQTLRKKLADRIEHLRKA